MAGLLSGRGWLVTVVTATRLDGFQELNEQFVVVRNTGLRTLFREISAADVAIINGGVSIAAGLVARAARKPFVIWHQMAGQLGRGAGLAGAIRNSVEVWLCRRAAAHVGVSHACLASKRLPVGVRSQVIFNPVSPALEEKARCCDQEGAASVDVLYVGRLIEGKGVLVLTEAVRKLSRHLPNLSVAVIGDGPLRGRMEAELHAIKGVKPVFAGALEASKLAEWYVRARCLVLPSTTHPEGMPLVIGEAQTFGLPVIASDQPANVESVGDAGIIAPVGNAEKLTEGLHLMLTNQQQRSQFRANALRLAPRYSTAHFADQVELLLRSVLPNHGRTSDQ
jgi:glycosyltransferase involved in cell wall biosynthesis